MARSGRSIEYFVAAGFAIAAFFISPFGIKLFAGRANLTFRVNVISVTVVIFLTALVTAILARGQLRRLCLYAVAWTFPFAALAGLEAVALYPSGGPHCAARRHVNSHKQGRVAGTSDERRPVLCRRRWITALPSLARPRRRD